jgi:hypothetical protein
MASTTGEEEPLLNGSLNTKSTALVSISTDMEEQHELVPASASSSNNGAEEKSMSRRVNRKMDTALLPFLSLLYLFNGLDRSNVGNAETQGTPKIRLLIVNGDHNHLPQGSRLISVLPRMISIWQSLCSLSRLYCFSLRQQLREDGSGPSIGSRSSWSVPNSGPRNGVN